MRTSLALVALVAAPVALAQTPDSVAAQATAPAVVMAAPVVTATLAEVVAADTTLSLFARGLTTANLMGALADTSKTFTVLAPSNAVLRALPSYGEMLERNDALGLFNLFMQHLVPGRYLAAQLPMVPSVKAWSGLDLPTVEVPLSVGGLHLTAADMPAANGLVHVVDAVLPVAASGTR